MRGVVKINLDNELSEILLNIDKIVVVKRLLFVCVSNAVTFVL